MRVVHMDSGLGNQMLDYAEYMAIQKMNPDDTNYLETIIYDLPDAPGMFSKWNGYELDRIFGIKVPNIKELFSDEAWTRILRKVEESQFWNDNWNFAPPIVAAINDEGFCIQNLQADRSLHLERPRTIKEKARGLITRFFNTSVGNFVKRSLRKVMRHSLIHKMNAEYNIYQKYDKDTFIGHSFAFKYKGFGIDRIEKEIREAFRFPDITDEKNMKTIELIRSVEAVSIHARRSDLLFLNGYCYRFGFFKRSVRYIKKHVDSPEFFFFCDENSVGWCQKNAKIFGLDFDIDKVHFVDWNKGQESYRDMQLMAECKHNIFTESTFGFWGAFLNKNPNKITCAPDVTILSTHTF